MWEEDVQTVRVLHRRVSEVRVGGEESGGESEEEFLIVGNDPSSPEHIPLLQRTNKKPRSAPSDAPLPSPPPSVSVPSPTTGGTSGATRSKLTHAESFFLEQGPTTTRLLLSNCGKSFSDPGTSPRDLPSAQPCIYGLLTAEQPYYSNKARSFAEKFSKAASNSKAVHLRWERPDFKVLYRFHSIAEYSAMVRDLKEGRLSEIKVKDETLRAVMLEPVRVVDASLKCMVEAVFPPSINEDVKGALKPVLEPIAISRRFIFIPSTPHIELLSAVEGTDSASQYPPLLISLITSQSQSSTERKISEALRSPNWMKCDIPLQLSSPKPFVHDEIFMYKENSTLLPLVGLTVGQAGKAIEDGIRLTLFSANNYPLMVKFYNLVLEADPVNMNNYVIFSLMTEPTSILELCIYDAHSISTLPIDWLSLHFFVSDLLPLVSQLSKEFKCDFSHLGKGFWQTKDPCGNTIIIHDRGTLVL